MPTLSASCSIKNNELTLSVVNSHTSLPADVRIDLRGRQVSDVQTRVLGHEDVAAHNTFDEPELVAPIVGQSDLASGDWQHTFAPASITVFTARLA
jgi:alpha-L-arabinofuranosidase